MSSETKTTSKTDPRVDNDVAGHLALVTGASGGIGAGVARALAALGLNLALHYSSSKDKAVALAEELKAAYPDLNISTHRADLSNVEEASKLPVEAKEHHGQPVLVLVPNAGVGNKVPHINDVTVEDFEFTYAVNLRAPFLLCKAVVPDMQAAQLGRIVTISSISAQRVGVNGCHYAASKGGIQGMVRNLATRLGKDNISVNDVAPAFIGETGMIPNAESVPGVIDQVPLRRLGLPDEIGSAVAMFVKTGFATGQSLIVSGGLPHL